ncbi:hypothetical protein ACWCXC_09195 [Streptomyces sp. NPDC001515]
MDEPRQHPGEAGTDTVVCALCGARTEDGTPPPTWLFSVENGSRRYFCEVCSRAHIRAVEGRLDSTWW